MTEYATGTDPTQQYGQVGSSDPSAKEKAADAANAGKQAAGQVAQTATEKAKDVVGETKQQAQSVLDQAMGQVREQAGAQHQNLVSMLRSLSDELGGMIEGNQHESGTATQLVSEAKQRSDRAADFLDSRQPSELIDEVRKFARQRPVMFLAGAALAGIAAGRLTRGVVSAHSDDAASSLSGSGSSDDRPLPGSGYAGAGYGQTGYGPTGAGLSGEGQSGWGQSGYEQQSGLEQTGYPSQTAGYSSPPTGDGVIGTGYEQSAPGPLGSEEYVREPYAGAPYDSQQYSSHSGQHAAEPFSEPTFTDPNEGPVR